MLHRLRIILVTTLFVSLFGGCKKWDDHNAITTEGLNQTALEIIKSKPELSVFAEMLGKTGYDTVLASSKLFTTWAPTNDALINMPASITGNIDSLKQFVANHIANQSFYTKQTNALGTRVKMLSGKYNFYYPAKIENADFVLSNIDTKNGVLYTINKSLIPIKNCWEFIKANQSLSPKMTAYLIGLNFDFFDPTKATIERIDPITGPVYVAGTGIFKKNYFLDTVQNINNEDKLYTVFLLTDNAFDAEFNKVSPYFKTSSIDSTASYSSGRVTMDIAVEGLYTPSNLPDTLISKYGVKIPLTKSNIVSSFKTSNGYVYVYNTMNFRIEEKFPPIVIQGENPTNRPSFGQYRTKYDSATRQNFQDVIYLNSGISNLFIRYDVKNFYSVKYKAYWVAYNDFQTATFQQRLWVNNSFYNNILLYVQPLSSTSTLYSIATTSIPFITVPVNSTAEVYIGDYEAKNFFPTNQVYLGGANSTTNGVTSMALDYIKLVPYY